MAALIKFKINVLIITCIVLFVCINIKSVEGWTVDFTIDELEKKLEEVQKSNWNLRQINVDLASEIGSTESFCNVTITRLKEYQTSTELELGILDSTVQNLFKRIQNEELIQSELESQLINLHDQLEMLDILYKISFQDQLIIENRYGNKTSQTCAKFMGNVENEELNINEIGTRSLSRKQITGHFQSMELELKLKFASIEETKLKAENMRLLLKKNHTEYLCELMVSDEKHMIENTEYLLSNSSHAVKIVTVDLALKKLLTKSLQIEYKLAQIFMSTVKELISHYQRRKNVNTMITTGFTTDFGHKIQ